MELLHVHVVIVIIGLPDRFLLRRNRHEPWVVPTQDIPAPLPPLGVVPDLGLPLLKSPGGCRRACGIVKGQQGPGERRAAGQSGRISPCPLGPGLMPWSFLNPCAASGG